MRRLLAALIAIPVLILLLPAIIVAGALCLFASCVRAVGRLLEPRFVPWTDLMVFDRRLGWRPRPSLDTHYLDPRDDVFHLVTDEEGWSGRRSLDESAVVVIGDSFAFGYGIDAGKGFADLNSELAVKGVGAPGFSMVQSVLLMEQFGKRLAGKLVIWFVCLENDLEDNMAPAMFRYRSPFIRRSRANGNWEIADQHVAPIPWQCADWGRKRLLPYLCVPGPISERVYAGCDYLVGRASAACQRAGARLVMLTIPDPILLTAEGRARLAATTGKSGECDETLPDQRLAESCARHGVHLVRGMDHLSGKDYKRIEGLHWNVQGHRRIAGVLGRLYDSFRAGALDGLAPAKAPALEDARAEAEGLFATAGQQAVSRGVTNN